MYVYIYTERDTNEHVCIHVICKYMYLHEYVYDL